MREKQRRLTLNGVATNPGLIITLVLVALVGSWYRSIQIDWPFVQAAGAGDINKVRAGLNSGIDVNRANEKGATALMAAMASGRPNKLAMVRFLLDHGADPGNAIYGAVSENSPDLVRLLIAHRADLNTRDSDGNTLIMVAEQQGQDKDAHQIIRILRAAGEVK